MRILLVKFKSFLPSSVSIRTRPGSWFWSTHQATVDDLPRSFLHLPQLRHKVPEAGLGHHVVGGEDPHAVQRGGRVLGRGQQTPDYFILPKLRAEPEHVRTSHRSQDLVARRKSVEPRIHFQRHESQRKATRFWFCLQARQSLATEDDGTFGLGCRKRPDRIRTELRSTLNISQTNS